MRPLSSRLLAAFLFLAFAPLAALHAEPAIIAKARAYLGPEEALKAVKSVHYTGSMVSVNAADPSKSETLAIDIIFQAPYLQRTVRTSGTRTDTIALDAYDGWHRLQDSTDPTRWRLQVLVTDQIKRQRAVVLENLSFFRGLERSGGKVDDLGTTMVGDVSCRKIAFIHAPDIIFYRYFDEATGRLIMSETETGSSIREQGEIRVNGIRFPKMIVSAAKSADGKEQKVSITFDTITLNESFPASIFAMPSFTGK